jgi:anti-sigma regulatory factor (Ser/Thr protein kinase)
MNKYRESSSNLPAIVQMEIRNSEDLPFARRRVGILAAKLGFTSTQQVQISTAVSEIVRNVLLYAKKGHLQARWTSKGMLIHVTDEGPGIPVETLGKLEAGTYKSKTGLGRGIIGAKKLMDRFTLMSVGSGTQIFMEKHL